MDRLFQRRYPSVGGVSNEQARELAAISFGIGRQVGVLIDRKGRPSMVIVGTPDGIYIPDLSRSRVAGTRLRGLRLVHTHLRGEGLSEEDLTDMLFLRLDSITALNVTAMAEPGMMYWAHLLPPGQPGPDDEPYRIFGPVRFDQVDFDFEGQAIALEDELGRSGEALARDETGREGVAILVNVSSQPRAEAEASLEELADLAKTAGLSVAETVIQRVSKVNPKFIMGKGKVAELEILALRTGAQTLVFDRELSPAQIRNLAEVTERKIIDRTQLILDIFAQHATTRSGKLQVEMAQLKYLLPRLVRQGHAMSRLMGGIGGRGPGETKLEMDRRKVRERIDRIKSDLKKLRKRRGNTRARRAKVGLPVVSLVGYTNAGKSTLLNTLTKSKVLAEDKLFATLDPTSRRLRFPQDKELILTDTVGFIRELPAELREAFQATLEELEAADLLVHVADAAHPELENRIEAVNGILHEMDLGDIPVILALNKWDIATPATREIILSRYPDAIPVSALSREGLRPLVRYIVDRVLWRERVDGATMYDGTSAFADELYTVSSEYENETDPLKD